MSVEFPNNNSGSCNDLPLNNFSQSHQTPTMPPGHHLDNRNIPRPLFYPPQAHYPDNRNRHPLLYTPPAHYANIMNRPHPPPRHYYINIAHPTLTRYPPPAHVGSTNIPHPPPYPPPTHVGSMNIPHPPPYAPPAHYLGKMNIPHLPMTHYPPLTHHLYNVNIPHRPPYPTPTHYTANMYKPHPTPENFSDKIHLAHQNPKDYADKRHSPHQTEEHIADKRHSPHQTEEHNADRRHSPHQIEEHIADKRHSPHQTEEHIADKRHSPHQTEEHIADKRHLPHQMSEDYGDKECLSHQTEEDTADKKHSPHQKPKNYADNKCLPNQMLEPPVSVVAPVRLPKLHCKICDVVFPHKNWEQHSNGKKHQMLREESKRKRTALWRQKRKQISFSQKNPAVQPKEVPSEGSKRKLGGNTGAKNHGFKSDIRGATGGKYMKMNNGTRMPMKSSKPEANAHEGKECHKFKNSTLEKNDRLQSNPVEMNASENSNRTESMSCDIAAIAPSEVSATSPASSPAAAVGSSSESENHIDSQREVTEAKEHYEIQNCALERNDQWDSIGSDINPLTEDTFCGSGTKATVLEQGPTTSEVLASSPPAAVGSSSESENRIDSPRQVTEAKEHYEIQNCALERIDQRDSICSDINPLTEDTFCGSGTKETVLEQGPTTSEVLTLLPAAGSSFEPPIPINSQLETEGEKHHEVQNCGVKTINQPHSISTEFHAPAGSDINTLIKDTCSDSGALVIAPRLSPIASSFESNCEQVIQTETSEGNVHNKIQNHITDLIDQQQTISMELDNSSGSTTNTQTEVVKSGSGAIEIVIEPLASAPPDAVGSCFEHLNEHDTEIEPQASEDLAYIENQHPNEEPDIQMLMGIDTHSEVSAETETEDDGSQAEAEMDVLNNDSGIIQLPQVSVCLTCGDEGFEEAIVYCNKCESYAMHRYCLKGPVVFTDDVIWFCEDCEEEVIDDVDYPDQDTSNSEKGEAGSNEQFVTVIDPQPIADPIWKGSLKVSDKLNGLMGHLSTLACPKVVEETRHLPDVLSAELLQRSDVWPESFMKYGTNHLSIGLYFFPHDERVERSFDQLVEEMICNDLAIKASFEKFELLIFPSTMLPSQYRRFQSKYYLWGIFKRKQKPSKINDDAGFGNDDASVLT